MKNFFIISFLISGLLYVGCKKDPSEVSQELDVDAIVEQQAAFGWQANQMVQTGGEIEELTRVSDFLEGDGIDTLAGVNALKKKAMGLSQQLKQELPKFKELYKPLGDSLVFQINYPQRGVRTALYYDPDSGTARYYEVKYANFAPLQAKTYDSAEVIIDVNFTLWDPSDDVLKNLHHTQHFNETILVHVQSIISNLEVTDLNGNEITGIILTQDFYYYPSRFLSHLKKFVELNPDNSGTLREDFDYKDDKTAYRSVTFNPDYTGTFEKKFRDGTTVDGTFNSLEDDLYGSWTELVDFPAGRYVDKIYREAEVEITLPDSVFEGSFSEIVYFASGDTASSSIDITIRDSSGIKITVLDIKKKNNAYGTFTIKEHPDVIYLEGEWITSAGYFVKIFDETRFYSDGSGYIHYGVWTSRTAYLDEEDPIIEVHYYFSPGGNGNGTLTYNKTETYQFTTDEGGNGVLSKDGKTKSFNLFQ